ncbi:hypothetical protein AAV32_14235 [Kerstersia gyiorum]|uniref:Uncharacterized protein n=1 Tax=Kerstersia gyiorum TaxID=206506 RepID=A0A171KPS0_9BURK|nr:hypothetical protein AAV32_14235 [Kerstersia gyiorum]
MAGAVAARASCPAGWPQQAGCAAPEGGRHGFGAVLSKRLIIVEETSLSQRGIDVLTIQLID